MLIESCVMFIRRSDPFKALFCEMICLFIDRLQPRDKAAMLVVKTIKNFFAEFA